MTSLASWLPAFVQRIGSAPDDTDETRLEKTILVSGSLLIIAAATLWGALFIFYLETGAGLLSLGYAAFTALSLLYFHRTHRMEAFLQVQFAFGLLIPLAHTLILGGIGHSGAVIIWSLISPMGALLFFDYRRSRGWWLAFLVGLGLAAVLQGSVARDNNLPQGIRTAFFVLNLGGVASIMVLLMRYFVREREAAYHLLRLEEQKSYDLLRNVLPEKIAQILKDDRRVIADSFAEASILFADLVGFTRLTAELEPKEMVRLLNEVFSRFDALVEVHGVEKIRTIGDNYMVVAGVPEPVPDHAERLARLALDMRAYLEQRRTPTGAPLIFRIGINSGPVIGGVIGRKKFVYDVWGDAVNIASRMESQGEPGEIQITRATYELIEDRFHCRHRGRIHVRGRGELESWFLIEEKQIDGKN